MEKLSLYEPALCCSTGVCGPSVDENLIRITGAMQQIRKMEGKSLIRYNLAANPDAFVRNETVRQLIQEKGADCLPITVLNNQTIVKTAAYPSNQEISEWLDVTLEQVETERG